MLRSRPGRLLLALLTLITGASTALPAGAAKAYYWFASTDLNHRNHDYLLLKPGESREVALGPGRLLRFWCTSSEPNDTEVSLKTDKAVREVLSRGHALVGDYHEKALVIYDGLMPSAVLTGLIVKNSGRHEDKFFYQCETGDGEGLFAKPAPTTVAARRLTLQPNQEGTLYEAKKPGTVQSLRFESPTGVRGLEDLRLLARWDNETSNSIDSPLPWLAAQFLSLSDSSSAMWKLDPHVLTLRWPMPCGAGSRIWLRNVSSHAVTVDCVIAISSARLPRRFCAVAGSARTRKGQPVRMLDAAAPPGSSGALAGLCMAIEPVGTAHHTFSFLEGNETVTVDGRRQEGTGTEDFFNSAWYFPAQPFSRPYHGLTFKSASPPRVAMYRLMIQDPLPFTRSLSFEFEQGNGNNTSDLLYRWVIFWYHSGDLHYSVPNELKEPVRQLAPANVGNSGLKPAYLAVVLVVVAALLTGLAKRRRAVPFN